MCKLLTAYLFIHAVITMAAPRTDWVDRVRKAECKQLSGLMQKLHMANRSLHQSCRGATLNQSDRCRGTELAEAYGELKARLAECRRNGEKVPYVNF